MKGLFLVSLTFTLASCSMEAINNTPQAGTQSTNEYKQKYPCDAHDSRKGSCTQAK